MGGRRRFDHLVLEVSLASGEAVPRYALWLRLHECGMDPEGLTLRNTVDFCDGPLRDFLAERGLRLHRAARRRLQRAISRFDPSVTTPDERLARL